MQTQCQQMLQITLVSVLLGNEGWGGNMALYNIVMGMSGLNQHGFDWEFGRWRGLKGGVEGGNVQYAIDILLKCSQIQRWTEQLLNKKSPATTEKIEIKNTVG